MPRQPWIEPAVLGLIAGGAVRLRLLWSLATVRAIWSTLRPVDAPCW